MDFKIQKSFDPHNYDWYFQSVAGLPLEHHLREAFPNCNCGVSSWRGIKPAIFIWPCCSPTSMTTRCPVFFWSWALTYILFRYHLYLSFKVGCVFKAVLRDRLWRPFFSFLKGKSILMLLTSLVLPNFLWPILRFAVSNELGDPCRSWLIAFPQSFSGMLCLRSTWHPGMKAISIKRTTTPMSLGVYYKCHKPVQLHKLTLVLPASLPPFSHTQSEACPGDSGCSQLCAAVWA